eukprot:gene21835-28865_t
MGLKSLWWFSYLFNVVGSYDAGFNTVTVCVGQGVKGVGSLPWFSYMSQVVGSYDAGLNLGQATPVSSALSLLLTLGVLLGTPVTAQLSGLYSNTPASSDLAANTVAPKYECKPNCTALGNCNLDRGMCDCPFGRSGPDCQHLLLPACRLENHSTALMSCDDVNLVPRNCECHLQCVRYYCMGRGLPTSPKCTKYYPIKPCFRQNQLPVEQQLSNVPTANETGVDYYHTYLSDLDQNITTYNEVMSKYKRTSGDRTSRVVPLEHCPKRCNGRGTCIALEIMNRKTRKYSCRCYTGYHGESCGSLYKLTTGHLGTANLISCLLDCSGRGTCVYGFCHCKPGYFGLGCTRSSSPLSVDRQNRGGRGHEALGVPTPLLWMPNVRTSGIYGTDLVFYSRLLADEEVRTPDPWKAQMFLIPVYAIFYGGNVAWHPGAAQHVWTIISYIKHTWPFWNRSKGRDHFFWVTNDIGGILWSHMHAYLSRPIKVVHFGYDVNGSNVPNGAKSLWRGFDEKRDVVVPPHDSKHVPTASSHIWANQDIGPFLKNKTRYLMFVGAFHYPGYVVGERYTDVIKSSQFCIAPPGWGWGVRLSTYAMHGCIPVIIQDNIYNPFEDVLPYDEFSIRLTSEEIPNLLDHLNAVSPSKLISMYESLAKHHRAFLWPADLGGAAYELAISSIYDRVKSRVTNYGCTRSTCHFRSKNKTMFAA